MVCMQVRRLKTLGKLLGAAPELAAHEARQAEADAAAHDDEARGAGDHRHEEHCGCINMLVMLVHCCCDHWEHAAQLTGHPGTWRLRLTPFSSRR
jgi:hypothetical protein